MRPIFFRSACALLGLCALMPVLTGCDNSNKGVPTAGKAGETPQDSMSRRLNDSHVSEAEKKQIREHLGSGGGASAADGK